MSDCKRCICDNTDFLNAEMTLRKLWCSHDYFTTVAKENWRLWPSGSAWWKEIGWGARMPWGENLFWSNEGFVELEQLGQLGFCRTETLGTQIMSGCPPPSAVLSMIRSGKFDSEDNSYSNWPWPLSKGLYLAWILITCHKKSICFRPKGLKRYLA